MRLHDSNSSKFDLSVIPEPQPPAQKGDEKGKPNGLPSAHV